MALAERIRVLRDEKLRLRNVRTELEARAARHFSFECYGVYGPAFLQRAVGHEGVGAIHGQSAGPYRTSARPPLPEVRSTVLRTCS